MAKRSSGNKNHRRPPVSPEDYERRLIGMAYELAEKQLQDGTASPSVVSHFLKMGSTRENLEEQHIQKKVDHLDAQINHIKSSEYAEELYRQALEAMKRYSGNQDEHL